MIFTAKVFIQWEDSTNDRKQLIFYNRCVVLEPRGAGITQDYRVWLEARFYLSVAIVLAVNCRFTTTCKFHTETD